MKPKGLKATDPTSILLNKKIELSQMSEWTDRGERIAQKSGGVINPRTLKAINSQKYNSMMDREGLKNELM